ncbi:MAG TPA: 3',5'-cyclic-nucleotide phosphodiesterase [Candidatus Mcinerneyibacteriales bacterium]|nr:3',5'-cyclic-nucleotide phosphodiesterase [Candidatus Mcinerneyibacteriales bacterium]
MEIRILGCYGNQLPGYKTTSFVINKAIALDAGSLTSTLELDEQLMLDAVLLTHSHIDHIKDLGFLGDNIIGRKGNPVSIIGEKRTLKALSDHYFNNSLWPDFTQIPTKDNPVYTYREIENKKEFELFGLTFLPVQVPHPVFTFSYFIRDHKSTLLHVSDTGETTEVWAMADKEPNLKAIFLETSFPNEMKGLAQASKHLTPEMMGEELKKLKKRETKVDVYIYHMKPLYEDKLKEEIARIEVEGFDIKVMQQGDVIRYV